MEHGGDGGVGVAEVFTLILRRSLGVSTRASPAPLSEEAWPVLHEDEEVFEALGHESVPPERLGVRAAVDGLEGQLRARRLCGEEDGHREAFAALDLAHAVRVLPARGEEERATATRLDGLVVRVVGEADAAALEVSALSRQVEHGGVVEGRHRRFVGVE